MGTTLEGCTTVAGRVRSRHSALRLAVLAARSALPAAGGRPDQVDVLINAGIYRDRNLGEPALAPLIQEDLGANPEDPHPGHGGTFSFDVANGACGVLTALQVADGFLRAGTAAMALVVASDADPGRGLAPDFPYAPAGGAVVCRWSSGEEGLGPVHWCRRSATGAAFRATVSLRQRANVLEVQESPAFPGEAAEAAASAAHRALSAGGLTGVGIDVVVTGLPADPYAGLLSDALEVPQDAVVTSPDGLHTAGLLAAIERARSDRRLGPGRTALLVDAGAGVTGGAALYRT